MKLDDETRAKMVLLARDAAFHFYLRTNPGATEEQAWRFTLRHWRQRRFIQVAAEILACWKVIDEDRAAPTN